MNKTLKRVIIIIGVMLVLLVGVVTGYMIYATPATAEAEAQICNTDTITVSEEKNCIVFMPKDVKAGLVFYPGGKVEYTAYAPICKAFAEQGIMCVLVRMPASLAILDTDAADEVIAAHPEVTRWYIGGHSLGGAAAAMYASEHADELEGLILMAAYSTEDLSNTDLKVYASYGTEDGVMNRDNYAKYWSNLPSDAKELVIEGGNHSGFGEYGLQKGDGVATITGEKQRQALMEFVQPIIQDETE